MHCSRISRVVCQRRLLKMNEGVEAVFRLGFMMYMIPTAILFFRGRISILFGLVNLTMGWFPILWIFLVIVALVAPRDLGWDWGAALERACNGRSLAHTVFDAGRGVNWDRVSSELRAPSSPGFRAWRRHSVEDAIRKIEEETP